MKSKIKKPIVLLCVILISLTLVSCRNKVSNLKQEDKTNMKNRTEEIETINTALVENIMKNIEEWEYVSDSFTQNFTYDKVEVESFYLYSAGKQGEYYFGTSYRMPTDGVHGLTMYHKIFFVSNTTFEYIYGNEYSSNDKTVKNCKQLYIQAALSYGTDRQVNIEKMIAEGLKAEKKYFEENSLNLEEDIILSDEGNALFNNMYFAILELENYKPKSGGIGFLTISLIKIKYYDLGNGNCEMLLYHGYSDENIISTTNYIQGYLVDENGYSKLSYSDESKLENTTNIETLEWNNDWDSDKKVYTLKKSIAKKYAIK